MQVFAGQASATATEQTYAIDPVPPGKTDLAAVEMAGGSVPGRFAIKRDIPVDGDRNEPIDMSNACEMEPHSLEFTGGYFGTVTLHTENGTTVSDLAVRGSGTWYKPRSGLLDSDLVKFYGVRQEKGPGGLEAHLISVIEHQSADRAGDYAYDLTTMPLLQVTTNQALPMRFDGLDYRDPDLVTYVVNISQTDRVIWLISMPKEWLSGTKSYEQPSLAGLERWEDGWSHASGVMTFWYVGAQMANVLPSDVAQDGLITRFASHQNAFTAP